MNRDAKELFRSFFNKPESILELIKSKKTIVIKNPVIINFLKLSGEKEGFIPPIKGFKAFSLAIIMLIFSPIKIKPSFKTPPLFVLDGKDTDIYFMAKHFHHWLAYIKGLPGYEEKTMQNFKEIIDSSNLDNVVNKLSMNEVLKLKEAIARDIESIKFVKEIVGEFFSIKKFLENQNKVSFQKS